MRWLGVTKHVAATKRPSRLIGWAPEISAVATAVLVTAWFAGVLVFRLSEFQDILGGIIALTLVGNTIALYWSRRERARLVTPTPA